MPRKVYKKLEPSFSLSFLFSLLLLYFSIAYHPVHLQMKFYYKRLCPFCEEVKSFSNYYNLRRHILKLHQHILPARKNTDKEDENARYLKDGEGQEATSFKMSCPCCVFYAQTKDDLSSHIQARHIHL